MATIITEDTGYQYDRELYEAVWDAQNACNSTALLPFLAGKVRDGIAAEIKLNSLGGTELFNKHPLLVVMCDKLMQLGGVHQYGNPAVDQAYDCVCRRSAKPEVANTV